MNRYSLASSASWPPPVLDKSVCELTEHITRFVGSWRTISYVRDGSQLHEVSRIVFGLLRNCTDNLVKISMEAGHFWAHCGKRAPPHLYHTVLECLEGLLGLPVVRQALEAATEAAAAAPSTRGPPAKQLLEALLYQRISCGASVMLESDDTCDLLDETIRLLMVSCPLPSFLGLVALMKSGALHLCSELLQPSDAANSDDEPPPSSQGQRLSMNELMAQALGYLESQMPLIHAKLPIDSLAEPLNGRLAALERNAKVNPRVWGALYAALRSFAWEHSIVGGYPQYTICKELFSFLHHGIPTPLTEEMRRALLLPKDPVGRHEEVLSRFNRILASSVYQHTEMAAMLALHDFQVQHWEWLEGHMDGLPTSRYKVLVEHLLSRAAGARRPPERPLSPAGNYANVLPAPQLPSAAKAPRLPKPQLQLTYIRSGAPAPARRLS